MNPVELAALHAICFDTPRPWQAKEFVDLLSSKQVFLVTAAQGFAVGRVAGPEVELLTLAVHPSARRGGIGQGLLDDFETQARILGATEAILEVSELNSAAINLYRKAGYKAAGYRKDYYGSKNQTKSTATVMRRKL